MPVLPFQNTGIDLAVSHIQKCYQRRAVEIDLLSQETRAFSVQLVGLAVEAALGRSLDWN